MGPGEEHGGFAEQTHSPGIFTSQESGVEREQEKDSCQIMAWNGVMSEVQQERTLPSLQAE